MLGILTNPITLLCLGVIFLLVSLLFFYFKRTITVLERSQMEQARILQAFITNMNMSYGLPNKIHHSQIEEQHTPEQEQLNSGLIDVSDDSESDDSDSDESESDDSESDVVSDNGINDENQQEEIQINDIETINDVGQLNGSGIKVIQLLENNLEEISRSKNHMSVLDDSSENESDADSDDESITDPGIDDDIIEEIIKINNNIDNNTKHITNIVQLDVDYKSLNVQALRELAIGKQLIQPGDKKTKKDLINLLSGK